MLHALARIIFEQTGLRLTSVVMMSGTEIEPAASETGYAQRMRMLFMVEVAELGPLQLDSSQFGKDFGYGSQKLDVCSIPVVSNPRKHRQHVWSREEDFKELIDSGLYPIEERAHYRMILEAFVLRKHNLAYLDSLFQQSQCAGSSHGFHV